MNYHIKLKILENSGFPYADCKIMGKSFNMLFDTGCQISRIGNHVANRLEITPHFHPVAPFISQAIQIDSLDIPETDLYMEDKCFNMASVNSYKHQTQMDGLLGMDIIQKLPFYIDNRGGEVIACIGDSPELRNQQKLFVQKDQYGRPFLDLIIANTHELFLLDTCATGCFSRVWSHDWPCTIKEAPLRTSTHVEKRKYMVAQNIQVVLSEYIKPTVELVYYPHDESILGLPFLKGLCLFYDGAGNYYISD